MVRFITELQDGKKSPASALRDAQLCQVEDANDVVEPVIPVLRSSMQFHVRLCAARN